MKTYLAGAMRGISEFNFPAFFEAEAKLREQGYEVFNPARNDVENGFEFQGKTGNEKVDVRNCLAEDTQWICLHADAIYMLPGWSNSKGARAEHALAVALGLEIMGAAG